MFIWLNQKNNFKKIYNIDTRNFDNFRNDYNESERAITSENLKPKFKFGWDNLTDRKLDMNNSNDKKNESNENVFDNGEHIESLDDNIEQNKEIQNEIYITPFKDKDKKILKLNLNVKEPDINNNKKRFDALNDSNHKNFIKTPQNLNFKLERSKFNNFYSSKKMYH